MTTLPGPGQPRELLDQLEEDVVDLERLVAQDAALSRADQSGSVPGSPEPPD